MTSNEAGQRRLRNALQFGGFADRGAQGYELGGSVQQFREDLPAAELDGLLLLFARSRLRSTIVSYRAWAASRQRRKALSEAVLADPIRPDHVSPPSRRRNIRTGSTKRALRFTRRSYPQRPRPPLTVLVDQFEVEVLVEAIDGVPVVLEVRPDSRAWGFPSYEVHCRHPLEHVFGGAVRQAVVNAYNCDVAWADPPTSLPVEQIPLSARWPAKAYRRNQRPRRPDPNEGWLLAFLSGSQNGS